MELIENPLSSIVVVDNNHFNNRSSRNPSRKTSGTSGSTDFEVPQRPIPQRQNVSTALEATIASTTADGDTSSTTTKNKPEGAKLRKKHRSSLSEACLPTDPLLSQEGPPSAVLHTHHHHRSLNLSQEINHPDGEEFKDVMMLTPLTVTMTSEGDVVTIVATSPVPLESGAQNGDDPEGERETWSQGMDFLLSIIGFAVDLANVWRFPYFCYKNGGGAFLIPYFLMLGLCAIPVFYMELLLGQFVRQGPISMWKICPLFKGIGYCAVTVSYFVSFYYNTIMGWSLHYTINSFTWDELPWTTCQNTWNTPDCFSDKEAALDNEISPNNVSSLSFDDNTLENVTWTNSSSRCGDKRCRPPHATSPASEYFRYSVLEMENHDIDNLGKPKLDLLVCLAIIYCLLYLILFRGIRSTGKVVWLTATLPYLVMLILLIRGLMLEGAYDGIYYYLVPNMTKLMEVGVWSDAAKQIFFSSGAGFGVHLTYASYNNFHNNCFRDCMVTSVVNCFTSIFAGFVIFTFLGSMAHRQQRPIEEVVNVGPGLVFEVYPEAVGSLPGASFWSLLFFLMLIMLGIDSAMGGLECVITGITDEFKVWFKGRKHGREWFMFGCVFVSFLISIINVTRGGMYTFIFFDTYAAGSSLLFAVLFEVIVVSWVYGLDQLCKDAESMLGFQPGIYWRICWKYVSPLLITVIIILDLSTALPLSYDGYLYPTWAQNFGYIFTFIPITLVPIVALREFFKFPGNLKSKLSYAITPTSEHSEIKNNGFVRRFKPSHWFSGRR